MGLDVYAGPLSRYYSGAWETIVQQMGRATGMHINVVRPKPPLGQRVSHFLRGLLRRPPDPVAAVQAWAASLSSYCPEGAVFTWPESPTGEYLTDKPAWDCYGALVVWAAYDAHRPSTPVPAAKVHWDRDPVYNAALSDGDGRYRHLLANTELWLPVNFNSPFTAPVPSGGHAVIGSVPRLHAALEDLNGRTWKASATDIAAWRGAGGALDAPLEGSARFAFSIFHALSAFALRLQVPLKLDY